MIVRVPARCNACTCAGACSRVICLTLPTPLQLRIKRGAKGGIWPPAYTYWVRTFLTKYSEGEWSPPLTPHEQVCSRYVTVL